MANSLGHSTGVAIALRHKRGYAVNEPGQIDLARAAPFRLGPIKVEPALRQVSTTTVSAETLEPRVMQVLVVLAAAGGDIVSRDELIRQCWDGRIVGEDSISRVIARLRRLADERGDGSFRIETIAKVGYRLIGPVSPVDSPAPRGLASAAVVVAANAQRSSSAVWRRSSAGAGAAALAALLALGVWWLRPAQPVPVAALYVEPFAISGVSADTVETLRSAILTANVPAKFQAIAGRGSAADYRLTGRMAQSPDGVTVFAELHAPGIAAPIWTPQVRIAGNAPMVGIGSQLALAARCVIEGAEEPPVPKPAAALAAWASYCEGNNKSNWDADELVDTLRAATKADPRFVSAQVTLASILAYHIMHNGGSDPDRLRDEAMQAQAVAQKLDPDNSNIYLTQAMLTPLHDFTSRQAQIARALRARPTGWGDEWNVQGYFLVSVGRLQDALDAYKRNLAILPGNPIITMARAETLTMAGRYRQAYPIFVDDAATKPDRTRIDRIWLTAAITGGDWAMARRLVTAVPDDQVRAAMGPLVAALASGDMRAAHAAGAAFEPIAKDSASLSALTVMALAWSGHDLAAIDAAERRFRTVGYNNSLGSLYSPGFASARQTPAFAALVHRIGLFEYWQSSGHPPDFCTAAQAPALCAQLGRRRTAG